MFVATHRGKLNSKYRQILPEEIPQAQVLYAQKYPGFPEPRWESVWIKVVDGALKGMIQFQILAAVGLLDGDSAADVKEMIDRADAHLAGMGIMEYEILIPQDNERFYRAVEKYMNLAPVEDAKPVRHYIVKRGI